MDGLNGIPTIWTHLATGLVFLISVLTSGHALLHKRDSRAATLWIGIIWLIPILGSILYLALGVNRIRRRAVLLRSENPSRVLPPENLGEPQEPEAEHLRMLARAVHNVVGRPLVGGNEFHPLVNGDEAFPVMLEAIEEARLSISLATYIFDDDPSGVRFAEALGRAVTRGVAVRVLIDAAGARYSWPSIIRRLKRLKVPVARFLPGLTPWTFMAMNLRNHRKLLIADGTVAFTGGINIRHGNVLQDQPSRPVQDLHFRVLGPVVSLLQEAFANDWAFTTREVLGGDAWFPDGVPCGDVAARVITDGPDTDFEKLRWTILAALAEAQSSIQIVTPYFLPDPAMVSALNIAVLRGVHVEVLLPSKNNLPFVHMASRAMWWQLLERGCRIWLTPPPFDHTKLMVVDGHWVLLGSANWDARSLRLNFELNVECYDREFAHRMLDLIGKKRLGAREVTLAEVDARPLPVRLADAAMRLFSPFL